MGGNSFFEKRVSPKPPSQNTLRQTLWERGAPKAFADSFKWAVDLIFRGFNISYGSVGFFVPKTEIAGRQTINCEE